MTLLQSEDVGRGVQAPLRAVQPGETGRNNIPLNNLSSLFFYVFLYQCCGYYEIKNLFVGYQFVDFGDHFVGYQFVGYQFVGCQFVGYQ